MKAVAPWGILMASGVFAASGLLAANADKFEGADGRPHQPFASTARARVFVFVRSDCPITNRYAPELRRLSEEFAARGAEFWLVYPDPAATADGIREHLARYGFPGSALRDPRHALVERAHAKIAPSAAVFDAQGQLLYHGRIDDQWVSPGQSRPVPRVHDLEDAVSAVLAGRRPPQTETRAVGCWLSDVQ